jgi:very-short-patch-repair endonuclease
MPSNEWSPRPASIRVARRAKALAIAAVQAGVVSRQQLYAAGFTRGEVRAQLRASRWQAIGRHCICTSTGPLTREGLWWSAVLEGGPRAHLDGVSALLYAGLEHFEERTVRVSVPRGAKIRHRGTSVDIRQTRRWDPADLAPAGVPHTRPAVAAVRAALWARSDRQAALVLNMVVQQGLVRVPDLASAMLRVRRDRRRLFIHGVLLDLAGGVRSLNELDFVRGCRERGLPEPEINALRRTADGKYYLDFRWEKWAVVVEVDGIQHAWVEHVVGDALRHNAVALSGDLVLRLPVLGLRVCPDDFFAQVEQALRHAGWGEAASRSA